MQTSASAYALTGKSEGSSPHQPTSRTCLCWEMQHITVHNLSAPTLVHLLTVDANEHTAFRRSGRASLVAHNILINTRVAGL